MSINKALLRNAVISGALACVLIKAVDSKVLHLADGAFERVNLEPNKQKLSPDRVALPTTGLGPTLHKIHSSLGCPSLIVSLLGGSFVRDQAIVALNQRLENNPPYNDDDDTADIDPWPNEILV